MSLFCFGYLCFCGFFFCFFFFCGDLHMFSIVLLYSKASCVGFFSKYVVILYDSFIVNLFFISAYTWVTSRVEGMPVVLDRL